VVVALSAPNAPAAPAGGKKRGGGAGAPTAGTIAALLSASAGAPSPNPQTVLVRVLSDQVEPTVQLLRAIRLAWRKEHWQLSAAAPRIWAM
jgi:hypothetical protein